MSDAKVQTKISFSAFCKHCREPWCVGKDYARMRAFLPSPARAGTYKIPCPYCQKKNSVTVEVERP